MAQNLASPPKTSSPSAKQPVANKSFLKDDFPIIRRASLHLGVSIVLAVSLVVGIRFVLTQQQNKQLQAETELTQMQEKLLVISSEKHDIDQYQPTYLSAIKRGFVGEEKRLDFVEHVKKIQETRRLLPLSYEIFPRQNVQLDPSILVGELELRASRIAIHLPLLHEGDMLNLLADLSQIGTFIPKNCSMVTKPNVEPNLIMPRLDGECELYWLSIGRRPVADPAQAVTPTQ
ncbi:MAG: hypothetical protein HY253_02910 [Burkholderiales bacterium]|nr:hypothetical protein [Burkholderiales bacterium]